MFIIEVLLSAVQGTVWKPDATMKAPERTGAEGVKSSHHSPRAEKPGEVGGNWERKLSLHISRFAETPPFFFFKCKHSLN